MTGEQVAAAMEWSSPSKLYKIEGGRQGIQVKELRELLGHYGVTDAPAVDALVILARQGKQRAWWTEYAEALPDSYATFIGLESEAAELRVYENVTVYGLLQTKEYARALLTTGAEAPQPDVAVEMIESRVRIRMERQAILTRPHPPKLWVILDEAVIRRMIGSPAIMKGQCSRLIEAAGMPSVKLQILPLRDRANPAPPTNFTIIEFAQESDRDVTYVELLTGGIYVEGAEDVRRYNVAYENLRAAALSPARSIALIEEVAAGRS